MLEKAVSVDFQKAPCRFPPGLLSCRCPKSWNPKHVKIREFPFSFRSEQLQNESSPNFSNFRPGFCPEFCSEVSPIFWGVFVLHFLGNREFPGKFQEKSTKHFLEIGQSKNFSPSFPEYSSGTPAEVPETVTAFSSFLTFDSSHRPPALKVLSRGQQGVFKWFSYTNGDLRCLGSGDSNH